MKLLVSLEHLHVGESFAAYHTAEKTKWSLEMSNQGRLIQRYLLERLVDQIVSVNEMLLEVFPLVKDAVAAFNGTL